MKRVAVIGGGFGGMGAALELAHEGYAVTVFEQSEALGGKARVVRDGGLVFDTGPTLLTDPRVVEQAFERASLTRLLPRFHRLGLHARYSWNDGTRFEAHESLERSIAAAEALGEGAAFRRFAVEAEKIWEAAGAPYLEAPFEGLPSFFARVMKRGAAKVLEGARLGTLDGLATRSFRTRYLRQFVGRFATYAGASPFESTAAFAMIPHLERVTGVHHVEGGMGALVKAFVQALGERGVDVRCSSGAVWERRSGTLVAGPKGHEQDFDALIINADPLGEPGRARGPLAMSGYVALLDVASETALPLAHHHVCFSDDYRREFEEIFGGTAPADPTVYFCNPSATDSTMVPPGHAGIFAMVNAPAFETPEQAARWSEWAPRLRERCITALRDLVPGLLASQVRLVAERTPVELAALGAPGGSIYGFLPHGAFAPFQRPRMRSSVPGVFYAGGSVHPGGGVPMVLRSGHFAANAVREHLGAVRSAEAA